MNFTSDDEIFDVSDQDDGMLLVKHLIACQCEAIILTHFIFIAELVYVV